MYSNVTKSAQSALSCLSAVCHAAATMAAQPGKAAVLIIDSNVR